MSSENTKAESTWECVYRFDCQPPPARKDSMDIILSFDTEDFITPEAMDAQKWWADELSERGIRASFQVVAELARTWQKRGRQDIIDAVSRHEIGNHTNYHSVPPTHPQGVSGMSLADGIDWVIRNEAASFATLESIFGRVPISYCSPGDSWTPATLLTMAARGVKVYCDSRLAERSNRPFWYGGLLNAGYNLDIECCFVGNGTTVDELIERVTSDLLSLDADDVYILYSHPTRLVTTDFWDVLFFDAASPPPENWTPAPLYAVDDVAENKRRARLLLDFLQAIPGLRFIDYSTMFAERSESRRDLQVLMDECGLAPGNEGRLPFKTPTSDNFVTAADFDDFSYGWGPLPRGFEGQDLIEQAKGLAWTASAAQSIDIYDE